MAATILIVEDEHAVARGIQDALQQEGYEVAVARSGEEGLDIARAMPVDAAIVDIMIGRTRTRQASWIAAVALLPAPRVLRRTSGPTGS